MTSALHQATACCAGEQTAIAHTRAALAAIAAEDHALRAFITVDSEGALAAAHTLDTALHKARAVAVPKQQLLQRWPLAGVCIAVKDVLVTRGLRTTCASKMLERYVPPYDATVITALRRAGAVIVGKTNMDEFAMGSSTENSAFFASKNPWDLRRTPGGSSGGSAVAVAARYVSLSLGTDTGGSVRQPAALTGVVGFKPTYGRVSRSGLVAFASSLDVVSPFARSVRDAELLYSVIAGGDVADATSAQVPVERADFSRNESLLKGLRVGVPREYFAQGISSAVEQSVRAALQQLQACGAQLVELSMPHTNYGVAAYYVLAPAEASSNLARFDGVRYGHRAVSDGAEGGIDALYGRSRQEGFGPEVKRRILLGTFALSEGYYDAFYGKAQRVRSLIRQDFIRAFREVDVIATPTSPVPAWPLGERTDDPLSMYLADICTLPASLAGVPAVSIPCATVETDGRELPVGLQLIGPAFAEAKLLAYAHAAECALGFSSSPVGTSKQATV
jgi:aspartyl-tRNA(Asn)/glutamyl-tRNA(Gln) amidotransferase subunit A